MRRHTTTALVLLALITAATAPVRAEEPPTPEMTEAMKAEMNAWVALAAPGEHHQHLDRFVGSWNGELKMWMAAETEPMTAETVATAQWVMGGRYIEWSHEGVFDDVPFEGRGIDGYNNGMTRYESTWIDNFGTLILYYTGECSDDGRTRTVETSFENPMDGGTISQRVVYTWVDDDEFRYESFMRHGDAEYQNMEILYSRR